MRKGIAVNLKGFIKVNGEPVTLPIGNRCFLCAGPDGGHEVICMGCLSDLVFNTDACPACAKPDSASRMCADCLNQPRTFVDNTWAIFQYNYPVNRLIQYLKFKQGIGVANYLGNILSQLFFNNGVTPPDCIMPVPLHSSRLIARGYNQSVELARPLSKRLGIKLDTVSCVRIRATAPQTDLPPNKRKQNVRNAFSMSEKAPYDHVLLVDDVITTGSTVNELARILRYTGVKKIDVLTCARAG
jgi:ComF family protein